MLMANSVEGRFPFLDHRLIEFANRLHPRYKMRVLREKYLLKEAMRARAAGVHPATGTNNPTARPTPPPSSGPARRNM